MKKVMALALALTLALSGCSSGGGGDTTGGGTATDQVYRQAYSGELTTINYMFTGSQNEFGAAANFVDTLIEYDQYGVVRPCLATDWTTSEDGLVWTFNLRKGVKWMTSTGEEYAETKAQDFVDSAKYILNKDNASNTSDVLYVLKNGEAYFNKEVTDFAQVGVRAIDDYTLEYTLSKPTPYFLSMLSYSCFFPVNGKFLEETGDQFGTDNTKLLYNGAYIMESFEPQNKRTYKANENYWDKENIFVKQLEFIYNKEAATLAPELFLRGELDYAEVPSTTVKEWMEDDTKKVQIRPYRTSFYSYFFAFNFDPIFDAKYEPENWKVAVNNLNFRQAIFHGLNREAAMMTAEPYNPKDKLTNTVTPANFVSIDGKDFVTMGKLGELAKKDTFDEKAALEFKKKAMEELSGKATFPVKVFMPYNTGLTEGTQRAQVIEQQLEETLGTDFVDVQLEGYPATNFLSETRRAGNYALLECNWGPDYADPETYTGPFTEEGNYNKPHMSDFDKDADGKSVYNKMVEEANAETTDLAKRYAMFADAEAYLIENAVILPYSLGGVGYEASKLNPFEGPYSPFGVSSLRYKWQKVMAKPMSTDEFHAEETKWQKAREEALKKAEK